MHKIMFNTWSNQGHVAHRRHAASVSVSREAEQMLGHPSMNSAMSEYRRGCTAQNCSDCNGLALSGKDRVWRECDGGPDLELSGDFKHRLEQDVEESREWAQRNWSDVASVRVLTCSNCVLLGIHLWRGQSAKPEEGRCPLGCIMATALLQIRFAESPALVRRTTPKYVHVSPPCGPWSSLQNANQRIRGQVSRLQEQRMVGRRSLKNCCKIVSVQREEQGQNAGCSHEAYEERQHVARSSLR